MALSYKFVCFFRLYHTRDGIQNKGIYVENNFDFGPSENHNDVDLIMRIKSGDVKNGNEFYTDMNGFQMQKRKLIPKINVEGNYYPITTMTYMEDRSTRVSLVVDHAQGAASLAPGSLEVMLDRRSTFDDARGMGEGVMDNKETQHRYWLLVEDVPLDKKRHKDSLSLPSEVATKLSNYLNFDSVQFVGFKSHSDPFVDRLNLMRPSKAPLACDLHLFNMRTLSDPKDPNLPSDSALMIWQRQSSDCELNSVSRCAAKTGDLSEFALSSLQPKRIRKTHLTGVSDDGPVLNSLSELGLDAMTIEAVKVTF